MSRFKKLQSLASTMKANHMDSKAGLLEALSLTYNDEVKRQASSLINTFATSIRSVLDLPKDVEADLYEFLMKRFGQEVRYVSEDGLETKTPAEVGASEDPMTSPDEVTFGGKKYRKMQPTTEADKEGKPGEPIVDVPVMQQPPTYEEVVTGT